EVVECAPRLRGDVAADELAGRRIQRDLAGEVDRVARARGLGIRTDGGGSVVAVDGLPGHAPILQSLHAVDHGQPAHAADDLGDVPAVAHFDREADRGDVAVPLQVFDP